MNEFRFGQIIRSKAGRDKNKLFIIIDIKDEYLYVVDGTLRRIENPKKKKKKHIQPMHIVIDSIEDKIINDKKLTNADIRKELIIYQNDPD